MGGHPRRSVDKMESREKANPPRAPPQVPCSEMHRRGDGAPGWRGAASPTESYFLLSPNTPKNTSESGAFP